MTTATPSKAKPSRLTKHPPFECIALLLQGGGALGSYQAGVYEALADANLHPEWVAGISIGSVNAALIAGNPPETRVEKLRDFWETVCTSPLGIPYFTPRMPTPVFWPSERPDAVSHYDVGPLKATLERLVDFDRINAGHMRF